MKITSSFVQIDNQKIHYTKLGNSKKCLLFVHGWGGSANSFTKLMQSIHKKTGYSTMAIDLPSFGKSESMSKKGWNTQDFADLLHKFIQKYPKKEFSIYAHSFGGRTTCNYLFNHPKKIKKLILSGSSGIVLPLTLRQKITKLLSKIFGFTKKIFGEKLINRIGAKLSGSHDWANADPAQKNTLKKVFNEKDFRNKLPKIKTPTLLLWGTNDSYTSLAAGKIFAEKMPNARLEVFSDGRHGLHYTHERKIINLLKNFLDE